MRKQLFFLLLIMQQTWAIDSQVISVYSPSVQNKVVRAYYTDVSSIQPLSEITVPWEVNAHQKYAVFMLESKKDFERIKKLGFVLRIDKKLQAKLDRDKSVAKNKSLTKAVAGIPGFSCYATVEETFSRMNTMATNYPDFTEIIDIGDSWEKTVNAANGYDMRVLKITNKNIVETKPVLFISSAVHAREYSTAELTTRFAEYLLSHYATDSDVKWMLDHQEVHFLLHNNPDGRKKAEAQVGGNPGWRKNTNQAYCAPASNSRGADLNRNYPFGWLGSTDECGDTYSGASPQSEPEISSLVSYINTIYDDNRGTGVNDVAPDDTPGVFIDVHSYSELILWPWGYTSGLSPNESQFSAFGRRVAYFNGYKPQRAAQLYTAAGVSIDTTYGDLGVASIIYELGTAFYQDCATFESQILPDNLQSLLYVSRVTRTPYITPFGPDIENLTLVPNVILSNESSTVLGMANDDRYNHSNGVQSVGQVQNVESFINVLPWQTANGSSLTATDGAFDSSLENFSGIINGSALNMGQNTVFVVSTDNEGKRGAVYSKFIDVVTPAQITALSGRVIDAVTGLPVPDVLLTINNSVARTNASGDYSQNIYPASNANVVASPSQAGYATQIVDNIDIIAGQSITKDFQLEPFCNYTLDTIESGNSSWVADSPWGITTNKSASPSHSWADSPNGNYQNNLSVSLTSEAINVTNMMGLHLSFNSFCDTESGYDFGLVEVSFDGGPWAGIFSCDGDANWKLINQEIAIESGAVSMQYRFRLTTDGSLTADGWYVDDVKLIAAGQVCHAVNPDVLFKNSFE